MSAVEQAEIQQQQQQQQQQQTKQAQSSGRFGFFSDPFARMVIVTAIAVIATLLGAYIMFQLVQSGVSPIIIVSMILGALVIVMFGEVLPSFIRNAETRKVARMASGALFAIFMLLAFALYYSSYHTSVAQLELTSLSGAMLLGAIMGAIIIVVSLLVYAYHRRRSSVRRTYIATY